MKKVTTKIIYALCLVGGTYIFTFNLFDFGSMGFDSGTHYYYSTDTQTYIAIGLGLIVFGLIIRSWTK